MGKYKKDLEKQLFHLKQTVKKQADKVQQMGIKHPDFMVEHERLNKIRCDVATIQSRIDNIGKDVVLPSYSLRS